MRRTVVLGIFWSTLVAGTAAAQAGHAPEKSPYIDLLAKQSASLIAGYLSGTRGKANVGPSHGPLAAVRYDHIIGTPMDIYVQLGFAHLNRFVVDPSKPPETRTTGPVKQDLIMMETGLSLVLMGRKTWHGFSPYVGGGLGVAFETGLSAEPSLYEFSTKGVLIPYAGLKWFPVQALAIKVEGRDYFWKLSYPTSFYVPPAVGVPPVLTAVIPAREWTMHPTILASIGYTFQF